MQDNPRDGPNNDVLVPNPPDDGIACVQFNPYGNLLVAGSWNKQALIYNIQETTGAVVPKALHAHNGAVLCADFLADGQTLITGSCDHLLRAWNPHIGVAVTLGQHQNAVKSVFAVHEVNCIVSGSWDSTMKFWDPRSPSKEVSSVTLPERVYAMDVKYPLCVVGTAERHLLLYDLRKNQTYKSLVSPLKMQTRCVSIFTNLTGYAVGSIEGRVAIQYVEDSQQTKNFIYKCHRVNNDVYGVNSISFHKYGTFATAGSDGVFNFWDKDSKQRLKAFQRYNEAISCATFNREGTMYAYGVSYDWSRGHEHHDKNKFPKIYIHHVQEEEIRQKNRN